MNRTIHSSNHHNSQLLSGLLRGELLGILCILAGALMFSSVIGFDPSCRAATPLLVTLMGWTAPLLALTV